ncbi:unnamed protein product [Boreogadus saida]
MVHRWCSALVYWCTEPPAPADAPPSPSFGGGGLAVLRGGRPGGGGGGASWAGGLTGQGCGGDMVREVPRLVSEPPCSSVLLSDEEVLEPPPGRAPGIVVAQAPATVAVFTDLDLVMQLACLHHLRFGLWAHF